MENLKNLEEKIKSDVILFGTFSFTTGFLGALGLDKLYHGSCEEYVASFIGAAGCALFGYLSGRDLLKDYKKLVGKEK